MPNGFRFWATFAGRIAGVMLILFMLKPAPDLVVVGERQTVESSMPIMGVHTRLTDEVEEWKIKRSLEMVREMGATTIVEFFPWAYYQDDNKNTKCKQEKPWNDVRRHDVT